MGHAVNEILMGLLLICIGGFLSFFPPIYCFVLRSRCKRMQRRIKDLENRVYGNADKDVK